MQALISSLYKYMFVLVLLEYIHPELFVMSVDNINLGIIDN